jgi:hypothetical protein
MKRLFLTGIAIEGALGLLGIALAALVGLDITELFAGGSGPGALPAGGRGPIPVPAARIGLGLLAALPPLAGFFYALRSSWPPLARIRRTLERTLVPHVRGLGVLRLLILAGVAGLGEELLFRGFLQPALARAVGDAAALILASVIFGLVHWISPFYALYAGVLGLYLGALFLLTGGLIAPILCHAAYDAVALGVYARRGSGDGVRRAHPVDEDRANRRAGESGHLASGVKRGASDVGQEDGVPE